MGDAGLRMFWAVGRSICYVGDKKTYFLYELLIFKSLSNNVYRKGGLIIENGGMSRLDRENSLSARLLFQC